MPEIDLIERDAIQLFGRWKTHDFGTRLDNISIVYVPNGHTKGHTKSNNGRHCAQTIVRMAFNKYVATYENIIE